MSLLKDLYHQIETIFHEHPHRFFTEHDIHSELARIASTQLCNLHESTRDGCLVNRIHHEYPTPFRCRMKSSDFRVITEHEFETEKNPQFRARRGFFDFVILNSKYVSSNKLRIVSCKRYKEFLESLDNLQFPALDLAIEVVYYPVFDEKLHIGTMKRKIKSITQDYKKLIAVRKFTDFYNTPFCKEAAMMFFSNTKHTNELTKILKHVPLNKKVSFFSILRT